MMTTEQPRAEFTVSLDGALFDRTMQRLEFALIDHAMSETRNNRTRAAAILGLNRTTLIEKIKKLGLVERYRLPANPYPHLAPHEAE